MHCHALSQPKLQEKLGVGPHEIVGDGDDIVVMPRRGPFGGEDGGLQSRNFGLVRRTVLLLATASAAILAPVRLLLLLLRLLLLFLLEPHFAGIPIIGGHHDQ